MALNEVNKLLVLPVFVLMFGRFAKPKKRVAVNEAKNNNPRGLRNFKLSLNAVLMLDQAMIARIA